MELTSQSLQEVTFSSKVRGYDIAEVDEFVVALCAGIDELQERLRRATDRAVNAEQELVAKEELLAKPVSPGVAVSKVWERAAVAAEEAVTDAKEEAHRILSEAQEQASVQSRNAKQESESIVRNAKEEANRISSEAQSQLRLDITKLEVARDQLKSDVAQLSDFLLQEKSRLTEHLKKALASVEHFGESVDIPEIDFTSPSLPPLSQTLEDQASSVVGYTGEKSRSFADSITSSNDSSFSDTPTDNEGQESDQTLESTEDEASNSDEEMDPFLAELRKAVQEESPLGPRDDFSRAPKSSSSIENLYSVDDEEDGDKSGFFRRRKQ